MTVLAAHPFPIFLRDLPHRDAIYQLLSPLQAYSHINANVLLYSIWFALTEQGRLRRPEFKKLHAVLHPWHERVSLALQQLNESAQQSRDLQPWIATEAEVANQFEQQILGQALTFNKKNRRSVNQQLSDASHNVVTYCKVMRVHLSDATRQTILAVLRLFFTDCPNEQIVPVLDQAIAAANLDDAGFVQLSLV